MFNIIKLIFQVFLMFCILDLAIVYLLCRRVNKVNLKNRNEIIKQRWIDGYSKSDIASEFKLSVSRIDAIVSNKEKWYKKNKKGKRIK